MAVIHTIPMFSLEIIYAISFVLYFKTMLYIFFVLRDKIIKCIYILIKVLKRMLLIFNLTLRKLMHSHETLVSSQLINSLIYSFK